MLKIPSRSNLIKHIYAGYVGRAILLAILVLGAGLLTAQSDAYPPLAWVNADDELWLYDLRQPPRLLAGNAQDVWHPVWDAEGRYLAFTRLDLASNTNRLLLFDTQTDTLSQLADGLIPGFPPAFTLDHSGLLYVSKTGSPPEFSAEIYRIPLQPAATPERIGEFSYAVGCAGGITSSESWVYAQETETSPGWGHLILAETPYGILHSVSCSGKGITLLDTATGEDHPLPADPRHPFLSPDHTQVIGSPNNDEVPLVLINLASGEPVPVPVNQAVSDMAWYDEDTVFYSAPRNTEGEWGIWKLELAARRSSILYRVRNTYLLTRLTPTADSSGLYFSQIVQPADSGNDTRITVNLLRLDLQTSAVKTIGSDIHKAAVHPLAP